MDKHHVVVVGAGYAGLLAAFRLARKTRSLARITLVNASDTFVERVRLHQSAAGQAVKSRALAPAAAKRGIAFVHGRVSSIQLGAKTLSVQTSAGTRTLAYDTLVYALGSTIERDRVPGVRQHAYILTDGPRGVADMAAALRGLPTGALVTVAGGGLTGIELATEMAESYPLLRFRLVTRGTIGEGLSAVAREHVYAALARLRIDLAEGSAIVRVEDYVAVIDDGRRVPHDVLLWAGSFAVPALAREAGLAVNPRGQVLVDETGRAVSHPDVYAVGDCAAAAPINGIDVRLSCQSAMPQGAHAAEVIAARLSGREPEPFRFGFLAQCISLGRRDAVVQFVRADDSPTGRVLTGRPAVVVKELVCRFAASISFMENRLFHPYSWLKPRSRTHASPQPARYTR